MMPPSRRLLIVTLAYLPVVAAGTALSFAYGVGARPGGDPARDVVFRGTALAPPLFLPALLVCAALLTRRPGPAGVLGAGVAGAVGLAFLLGSTANLSNDLEAARAAASPVALTIAMAVVHFALSILLLWNASASVTTRFRR